MSGPGKLATTTAWTPEQRAAKIAELLPGHPSPGIAAASPAVVVEILLGNETPVAEAWRRASCLEEACGRQHFPNHSHALHVDERGTFIIESVMSAVACRVVACTAKPGLLDAILAIHPDGAPYKNCIPSGAFFRLELSPHHVSAAITAALLPSGDVMDRHELMRWLAS